MMNQVMQQQMKTLHTFNSRHLQETSQQSPLIELAHQFADNSRPTQKDFTKFRDMFYVLVLRASADERKKMSKILAKSEYTPRAIALYLALEDDDIGHPILAHSPVLSSYDLEKVIEKKGFEAAKIICKRDNLDERTIKLLMKNDDLNKTITRFLSNNKETDFVATKILTRSETKHETPRVQSKPILKAATKQEIQIPEPITSVSDDVEEDVSVRDLSKALMNLARVSDQSDKLVSRTEPTPPIQKKEPRLKPVISYRDATHAADMLDRARRHDLDGLASLIGRHIMLTEKQILIVLSEDNAGLQASLFCALELSKITASKLLLLVNKNIGRNADIFKRVMQKYEIMDKQECMKLFEGMIAENTKPTEHSSHFSAAIAERRRNITTPELQRKPQKPFGKVVNL